MSEYLSVISNFLRDLVAGLISKIVVAVIILLIGFILGTAANKIIQRGLGKIQLNKVIKDISGIRVSFEEIIAHSAMYFIYFVTIIMALRHLGIATEILNVISGVIIILIGVFILLSVKDFIPNIISGIVLHQKQTIQIGDVIVINSTKGKVTEMTLLETKLKTKSGDVIIIPNSNLTKNEIVKKKRL